ncbi:MAG: putative ABC-transporter ATP-binding protein [Herbaspirillum sp.]|jgi:ABC-type uncharacterized transport system ATPase subunit|nr:putative ABC-transporter ATP-binding protein [Herbaspirillum sp.]
MQEIMLEMRGICKAFGAVKANHEIDLKVGKGAITALLGENGSGKSTLMKLLFGMERPDSGTIIWKGRELSSHGPREAIAAGIGMIHQHFMLVESMSVVDNVMLGWPRAGKWLRRAEIAREIREASARYGLELDPEQLVSNLPFGTRQRIEIVKAIMRGADLLIFDEPTSNLSAPEVAGLLAVMRRLKSDGRSIIFISHKLGEVMEICDDGVILRDGKVAGHFQAGAVTRATLARMMVDRDLESVPERVTWSENNEILKVEGLNLQSAQGRPLLENVTFSLRAGEVFAIAGVDGNGQTELIETLAGMRSPTSGAVHLGGVDITFANVRSRLAAGMAYIPVDRANTSLVPAMSIEDNMALRDFDAKPWRRGPWQDRAAYRAMATQRIAEFGIACGGPGVPAATLSGGNQQKIVLARELGRRPRVVLAAQPTWGLDPGATRFVIDQVLALRNEGAAVLYVSSELEEVMMLGDRIGVMSRGRLGGIVPRSEVDLTAIGLMMVGAQAESEPLRETE